jgi:hypothetical protein
VQHVNGSSPPDTALFEGGPPLGLQRRLGLIKDQNLHVGRRALLAVLIGWAPLVLLAIVQNATMHTNGNTSVFWEIEVHARYLLAAPLLIFAETGCAARLSAIVHHFVDAGVVPERERSGFDAAIASTRRWLGSTTAEIVVIAVAYIVVAAMVYSTPIGQVPLWHRSSGVVPVYSPAGWWHLLVSMPLLLVLFLGWLVRIALWARLLWLISRLDLRLVASHPDRAAGLGFVGHSVRGFSFVALALATIAAGKSAHLVLLGGTLPTSNLLFNVGLLATTAAMFTAPLLVFTPTLMSIWRRAAFDYGALADRVGVAFENKWLARDRCVDQTTLDSTDFTAMTDLNAVVANIYELRLIPIDVKSLAALGLAMLLPFVPVVLLTVPISEILAGLKALLL